MSTKDALRVGCPQNQSESTREPVDPSQESYIDGVKRQINAAACGKSINDIQNNVAVMAGESVNGLKERVGNVTSVQQAGDAVKSAGEGIAAWARGGRETIEKEEMERGNDTLADPEEQGRIDRLDKGQIEEFLREKHRSTNGVIDPDAG